MFQGGELVENQPGLTEKNKLMYQRFATGFLLFFWGLLIGTIDLKISGSGSGLNIFPDFIGALLILLGSICFVTQRDVFRGIFRCLVLALPITAFVLFTDSIVTLTAFNSEVPIWGWFTDLMEILLYLSFIGLGWKIASAYVPSAKKHWAVIIGFAGVFVLTVVALLIADQVMDLDTIEINITSQTIFAEKTGDLLAFAIFVIVLVISFIVYFLYAILDTREKLLKKISPMNTVTKKGST